MYALNTADVRAVLDGAAELLAVADARDLPHAMLRVVGRLVPSDSLSYNEVDVVNARATIVNSGPEPDPDLAGWFAAHARENPIIAHHERSGDGSPLRMSDFISTRELHRRPVYNLIYRPLGIEYQLALGLAGPGGAVTGVALNRWRPDFSDRDVAVLELLRPLLAQIRAGWQIRADRPPPIPAQARLTPRQRDVVTLLSRGATNREIAQRLVISERTVAKHLEHIYRELGVSNRTAAVAEVRDSAYCLEPARRVQSTP